MSSLGKVYHCDFFPQPQYQGSLLTKVHCNKKERGKETKLFETANKTQEFLCVMDDEKSLGYKQIYRH